MTHDRRFLQIRFFNKYQLTKAVRANIRTFSLRMLTIHVAQRVIIVFSII